MEPHGTTTKDHEWAQQPTVVVGAAAARSAAPAPGLTLDEPELSSDGDDEDEADLSVPERLGRFLVLRRLGTGGMGTVLEAYDETLDRKVAVKRLHRDASGDAGEHHRQRLLREAQALARLSHPNVVQVYDVGEHEGRFYIAMELVEGQTLWEWQKLPRPWTEVLHAYMGAGAGLAAAHEQGIVHRDFKPTNCIIDAQGRVKVLDFGLARGVDDMLDEPADEVPTPGRAARAVVKAYCARAAKALNLTTDELRTKLQGGTSLGAVADAAGVDRQVVVDAIVAAAKEVDLSVPLVVRLEGTNVNEGKKIIAESGLDVVPADDLDDAAQKIVAAVKKAA